MTRNTLADWLRWQESLSPHDIDLGLDRLRIVAQRLSLDVPAGNVFTIGGTNGKGSTAGFLESLMSANGLGTGVYTSPHLVRYNERMRINGDPVDDRQLVEAFEAVESARGDVTLTYFEYGTLGAAVVFSRARSDIWILEVGLGGRLDAVNVIDPNYSLITTVALDHQEWLGQTVDAIAAEKAGIMRADSVAFYGDQPSLTVVESRAAELGTSLHRFGMEYDYEAGPRRWTWRGQAEVLSDLPYPEVADGAQLRNVSLVLAAVEAYDPLLLNRPAVEKALRATRPPGRFQIVQREHEWVLDVAHNPQAADVLRERLDALPEPVETTAVVGMLADKEAESFAMKLADCVDRWVVCTVQDSRAVGGEKLAASIEAVGGRVAKICLTPDDALKSAVRLTSEGGRILVCGSFRIVGPALRWLRLY
jgi:dihydrofolate synthase/folylpolyglutamate synthase